jgi:hypothetical protein
VKYDPNGLVNLAQQTAEKYVRVKEPGAAGGPRVITVDPKNPRVERIIPLTQWVEGILTAASIMQAESGGDTDARCFNIDGPDGKPTCSATGPAGPRGVDRGLWQWNNVAWPDISDLAAFDPVVSSDIAYRVSDGFRSWAPWTTPTSLGLDPNSRPSKLIRESTNARALRGEYLTTGTEEIPFTPIDVPRIDVFGWADALGRFLSALISPAFWRRVGIGAAGIALVVLAVLVLNRGNIAAVARVVA